MKVVIQIISGARAGHQAEFPDATLVRLGRRPGNDLQFDVQQDLDVSGNHAEIRREPDGLYLYDIGSANGTFVGGARVTRLRLVDGQQITFGPNGPRVQVHLPGDVPGAAPARAKAAPAQPVPLPPAAPAAPAPVFPGAPPGAVPAGHGQAPAPLVGAVGVAAVAPSPKPPGPVTPATPGPATPATPGQQVAAALDGRRVGARTVAVMIDQALKQAQGTQDKGRVGRSTVFLRSMVNQAVTTSTRRFKVMAVILVALLLGSVGGFLVLRHYERQESSKSETDLRKQMATLMTAINQQQNLPADKRAALSKKLESVRSQLSSNPTPQAAGKSIVQTNRDAIFLLAFNTQQGQAKGFCTGFAVGKRLLATNAHCVVALERFRSAGMSTYVVMNRHPSRRHRILRTVRHPRYHKPVKTITEDVGLLTIDADLPTQVTFASQAVLRGLESGDVMYTYGFPGRLARVHSPNATLVQGIVGRVTKLDGDTGTFDQNRLIQHSAFTSGGTSGSPIFNAQGQVIAVNAGGYVESGTLRVMDPLTGKAKQLRVAKTLAGYNFGIRIDVLQDFMRQQ